MTKKILGFSMIGIFILVILGVISYVLVWNGEIILNSFSASKYPVKGVDVSSYQGDIDWQTLSSQDISFVFIKATEGSSFVDKYFADNYAEAQKTDLSVGAYHFFSYDSAGITQAENFINTVAPHVGMLPPVIDLEFYGNKTENPPTKEYVDEQLKEMLNALEAHYKMKPIIYATETTYELYLVNDYQEYDIWIRNVITTPKLSDGRTWKFWQYTNREKLDGYIGKEKYIDMNVFHGNIEEYNAYLKDHTYT